MLHAALPHGHKYAARTRRVRCCIAGKRQRDLLVRLRGLESRSGHVGLGRPLHQYRVEGGVRCGGRLGPAPLRCLRVRGGSRL